MCIRDRPPGWGRFPPTMMGERTASAPPATLPPRRRRPRRRTTWHPVPGCAPSATSRGSRASSRRPRERSEVGDVDDPAADRVLQQLHPVVEAELLHDIGPVIVDGLLREVERPGDLPVGVADGSQEHDLALALAQILVPVSYTHL